MTAPPHLIPTRVTADQPAGTPTEPHQTTPWAMYLGIGFVALIAGVGIGQGITPPPTTATEPAVCATAVRTANILLGDLSGTVVDMLDSITAGDTAGINRATDIVTDDLTPRAELFATQRDRCLR